MTGGPETVHEFQALLDQSLDPFQQNIQEARWNIRLGYQHIMKSRDYTIPELVREVRRVNEFIEERLHDYYRMRGRNIMLTYASLRHGEGFLRLPVETLEQIRRDSLRVNIPQTGGPDPQEVRRYIMGLSVWNEL